MSSLICSTFSVILLVLGRPKHLSPSTNTRLALKCECYSKTTVQLKERSPKASRSISRVSVVDLASFTQNLMQTRCSILPSNADKTKHKVEKQCMFTAKCQMATDPIGLQKCDLGIPSHLLSLRQLQQK
jgi:hypothetical protein